MVRPEKAPQSSCEAGIGYLRLGGALSLMTMESRYHFYLYQVSAVKKDVGDKIDIFRYQGKEVRIVKDEQGDPWWVAKDVCDILELKNSSKALEGLEEDEKGITISDTLGGPQEMLIISEAGYYHLVHRRNTKKARDIQRWTFHEVLPAIRRTGPI